MGVTNRRLFAMAIILLCLSQGFSPNRYVEDVRFISQFSQQVVCVISALLDLHFIRDAVIKVKIFKHPEDNLQLRTQDICYW